MKAESIKDGVGRDEELLAGLVLIFAAEQGYAPAQCKLGVMFRDGRGVGQDDREAVKWFRKAAEQGYAPAQFNLALSYWVGRGVGEDSAEAAKWIRRAAEQGYAPVRVLLSKIANKLCAGRYKRAKNK